MFLHRLNRFAEFHIYLAHNKVQHGSPPKDLNIMQALFRLLFEAFNLLFFDFFLCSFLFLASEVLDFEAMW